MGQILNFAYYSLANIIHIIVSFLLISAYWNIGLVFMELIPLGPLCKNGNMTCKIAWGCFWPIMSLWAIAIIFALTIMLMVGFMTFIFWKITMGVFATVVGNKKDAPSAVNIRTIFNGEALSSFMDVVHRDF
jgi:hypothetical protein